MTLSGKVSADETGHVEPIDEAHLIARARLEDEAAWTTLVRHHQEPVFRLVYLFLRDAAEAEDVAQEAFVRAYLNLEKFDEARPFQPWIFSIAANLARNRRRSIGRYWAAVRRFWQAEPKPGVDRMPLDQRQEAHLMKQAVERLNDKAQEIIYLRYYLDMSVAETAAALDVPPGTVKSRLHRALKQLQGVIEIEFPELNP